MAARVSNRIDPDWACTGRVGRAARVAARVANRMAAALNARSTMERYLAKFIPFAIFAPVDKTDIAVSSSETKIISYRPRE